MKTDRELLEMAAKAAGIVGDYFEGDNPIHTGIYRAEHQYYWNPLISDSEAFRLLMLCRLDIFNSGEEVVQVVGYKRKIYADELRSDDAQSAARRAIVRAAAEIGEAMP